MKKTYKNLYHIQKMLNPKIEKVDSNISVRILASKEDYVYSDFKEISRITINTIATLSSSETSKQRTTKT